MEQFGRLIVQLFHLQLGRLLLIAGKTWLKALYRTLHRPAMPAEAPTHHVTINPFRETRFVVSIFVVLSMGTVLHLGHTMLVGSEGVLKYIGSAIVIFLAAFSYEWTIVHSGALTRAKKAYFDEANVLETYQPRARTMGHLFCPEPPTPAPVVKITEGVDPGRHTAVENAEFNALRDSHYANMFAHAMKMKKELEAMEKEGNYGGASAATSTATNEGDAAAREVGTDGAAATDESIELNMAPANSKDNKRVMPGGYKET
uniref:Uncharacterized protein n=1 Tax=Ascaris lumbricoides TaxID=6252 RepID=A0A0M3HWG2_ASCLU